MLQLLNMIEYLWWKYGKDSIKDKRRVFDFMSKFMILDNSDIAEATKFLYDSGIVSALSTVSPQEQEIKLTQAFAVFNEEFPSDDGFTNNIFAIVARGLGYPMDLLEPYCESALTGIKEHIRNLGDKSLDELEAINEYFLGNFYALSNNKAEGAAIDHWTKAAEAGNVSAIKNLLEGLQGEKEETEKWYSKMLESEDGIGLFEAGTAYCELGDKDRGRELLEKSADLGVVVSMLSLYGLLVDEFNDPVGGEEWVAKAANAGFTSANIAMGKLAFDKGEFGEALEWYIKGVQPDNFNLMVHISAIYFKEFQDYDNAEKWLVRAAEGGDPYILHYLGDFYLQYKEDPLNAKKYYLKASIAGDADAMAKLGILYEHTFFDDKKAEKCYRRSAAMGSADGKECYKNLLKRRKKNKARQKFKLKGKKK